ncbi:uncharacterized protein LOC133331819 [Musca vetustissima]|uniref:uncharacterized protein LOC133331819 n=1 Tax=Musca vetustissima TaxID=27455 RepID=UPI002AB5E34F|nr:uncharacterized protein LOC133331819 [Musca vetustissima]
MKFLTFTVLFGLFVVGAIGKGVETSYRSEEHPGKCVYKDLILSPGEVGLPKGECQRFTCQEKLTGKIRTCDDIKFIVEPPCRAGDFENNGLPYPQCCMRKVVCPDH